MPNLMELTIDQTKQQLEANAIAQQNDAFRKLRATCDSIGRWLVTAHVNSQGPEFVNKAVDAVRSFDAFTEDNDPHGDHTFGAVEVEGKTVWWKIDLYDRRYEGGSEHPAEVTETRRVLTILFPSEY